MWCGRKGIDCPYSGVFGECNRSDCGLPNAEPSALGTSSSYSVNTTKEKSIDDIRREAVKEFAEKLWNKIKDKGIDYKIGLRALGEEIDELLKEYEK